MTNFPLPSNKRRVTMILRVGELMQRQDPSRILDKCKLSKTWQLESTLEKTSSEMETLHSLSCLRRGKLSEGAISLGKSQDPMLTKSRVDAERSTDNGSGQSVSFSGSPCVYSKA